MQKTKIIYDQEYFFNLNSQVDKKIKHGPFFEYATKEAVVGFRWLRDRTPFLDYGCGVGLTLQLYLDTTGNYDYEVYGVDIAEGAINKIKEKFKGNNYKFLKIQNNQLNQIKDSSLQGAYLIHVLHHAKKHEDIFNEISKKLAPGGKFFICDLSSSNIIISLSRKIFMIMPNFIKNRFSGDLVINGAIPDKYKVSISKVIVQLKQAGLEIETVGYGHLFVFLFSWLDKFTGLSRFKLFLKIYILFTKLEDFLLKYKLFQRQAELFYVKCIKK